MNNLIRMGSYPAVMTSDPGEIGEMRYDPSTLQMYVFNGKIWIGVHIGNEEIHRCVVCKYPEYNHGTEGEEQHPFLRNNLELLEWKYEQSIR